MRCPICKIAWPQPLACCPCGYAPDSLDMFVVQLKLRRRRGLLQIVLGATLLALLLPAWWLVQGIAGGMIITAISGSIITLSGVTVVGRGMLQVGRATRHQLAVEELRQLPIARVRQLKS